MYQSKKNKSGVWHYELDSYLGAAASISLAIALYRTFSRKTTLSNQDIAATESTATVTGGQQELELDKFRQGRTLPSAFDSQTLSESQATYFWGRCLIRLWVRHLRRKSRRETTDVTCQSMTAAELRELWASCHCSSILIALKVPAGRMFQVNHVRSGKYQFPHLTISPQHFQIQRGDQSISLYYDVTQKHSVAYGFCRKCGVHLFRAFEDKDQGLEVNFNCIEVSPSIEESQPAPLIETESSHTTVDMDEEHHFCRNLETYAGPSTPSTALSSSLASQDLSLYRISSPRVFTDDYIERIIENPPPHTHMPQGLGNERITTKARSLFTDNPSKKIISSRRSVDHMKKYMNKYLSGK